MLLNSIILHILLLANIRRSDTFSGVETVNTTDLRECFDHKRAYEDLGFPYLVAKPEMKRTHWCLRVFTDKNHHSFENLQHHSGKPYKFQSFCEFSWRLLRNSNETQPGVCNVTYSGYRGVYRLAPDFGGYSECNQVISAFNTLRSKNTSSSPYYPVKVNRCSLKKLPLQNDDFLACTLHRDNWYLMHFRSGAHWRNENGTEMRAPEGTSFHVLHTVDKYEGDKNGIYQNVFLAHTQAQGCFLNTVLLLRKKLPFKLAVHVRMEAFGENQANSIKDGHVRTISAGDMGKNWTSLLPNGTDRVDYCYSAVAVVDVERDEVALPLNGNNGQTCMLLKVNDCRKVREALTADGNSAAGMEISLVMYFISVAVAMLSSSLFENPV